MRTLLLSRMLSAKPRRRYFCLAAFTAALMACGLTAQPLEIADGQLARLVVGGRNRIPPQHDEPLWLLELQERTTGRFINIASNATDRVRADPGGRSAPDAVQSTRWTIRVDAGAEPVAILDTWVTRTDAGFEFYCAVDRLDPEYALWRIWYPQVPLLPLGADADDDRLAIPVAYGQIIERIHETKPRTFRREPSITAIARTHYPAWNATLQMNYYWDDGGGILFMTPDESRRIKELIVDRPNGHLRSTFIHYLTPLVPLTERVELRYPVRIQWVAGDWYDAAQVYRDWAMLQPWAVKPGPLATRDRTPEWFRGMPSWARINRDPDLDWDEKTTWPLEWADAVGGPMALHWYGWDNQGGPWNNIWPIQLPPVDKFRSLLQKYHRAGLVVLPYLNVRILRIGGPAWGEFIDTVVRTPAGEITDPEKWRTQYWDTVEAEKARADGRRVTVTETAKGPLYDVYYDFAVGCLGDPKWAKSIVDRSLELILQHQVDGVYQDQLGAQAMLCYDERHGHKPGDPLAWITGQEKLYTEIYDAVKRQGRKTLLFSEYLGEEMISVVDGGLTVNPGSLSANRPVPLFPAVYHTHFASIGWGKEDQRTLRVAPSMYLQQRMMPFVYGGQLGWLGLTIPRLLAEHPELVACYKAAVSLRLKYPSSLAYGKMLRPPVMEGVEMIMAPTESDRMRPHPFPAIIGGFFQDAEEKTRAVAVFCNWTAEPRSAKARLDVRELPGPVRYRRENGELSGPHDGPELAMTIELPPASVTAVFLEAVASYR